VSAAADVVVAEQASCDQDVVDGQVRVSVVVRSAKTGRVLWRAPGIGTAIQQELAQGPMPAISIEANPLNNGATRGTPVLLLGRDGTIQARSRLKGDLKWTATLDGRVPIGSGHDLTLLQSMSDASVTAIDRRTGATRWSGTPTVGDTPIAGYVAADRAVLASSIGAPGAADAAFRVTALDVASGRVEWQQTVAAFQPTGAGVVDGSFVFRSTLATFQALSLETGEQRWTSDGLLAGVRDRQPGSALALEPSDDGSEIKSLDPSAAQSVWTHTLKTQSFYAQAFSTGQVITIGSGPTALLALNPHTGRTAWKTALARSTSGIISGPSTVLVGRGCPATE
jgi:outer membrane protein assembly factor BamB